MRFICPFAYVFPDANKIDLRGIFEAAARLGQGTEGRHLCIAQEPGIEIRAVRHFLPFDTGRAVAALSRDATGIQIRRFDYVCVPRDNLVISHGVSSLSCLGTVFIPQYMHAPAVDSP